MLIKNNHTFDEIGEIEDVYEKGVLAMHMSMKITRL